MLKNKLYINQKNLIVIFIILTFFSVFSMFFLDLQIAEFIHIHQYKPVVEVFEIISFISRPILVVSLFLLLYIIFRVKDKAKFADYTNKFLFVILATLTSGILNTIIKFIFNRYRPYSYFENGLYGFDTFSLYTDITLYGIDSSFPSGHAMCISATMFSLIMFFPKYKFIWWSIIFTVMVARMITESHFLSDVLMGAYLGIVTTIYLYSYTYAKKYIER